jgi:hypothetical protein
LRLGVSAQHREYFGALFILVVFVRFVFLVGVLEVIGFEDLRLCEIETFG